MTDDGFRNRSSPLVLSRLVSSVVQVQGRLISILITIAAIALAGLHVARPQLTIDAVTVALVAIAFVPWLAPVIKSVTLPGGFAIELRDVKQQLDQVSQRVSRVERFVFSGPIGEAEQNRLRQKLEDFSRYMEGLGFPALSPVPRIQVTDDIIGSAFNPETNEILLSKFLVADVEFLFHEYTHSVLLARFGDGNVSQSGRLPFDQMESGVALYFPCSFVANPMFGSEDAAKVFGVKTPYLATLENSLRMKDVPSNDAMGGSLTAGQVWGAALWSLRSQLSAGKADQLIARSWLTTAAAKSRQNVAAFFLEDLIKAVSASAGNDQTNLLRANLTQRGLLGRPK